ncbi:DUF2207 domain-containing protein [Hippea alviniae]|uniref:DUF2207 domain-containing protein n=1 Tax=Hippea alviniae TaxID=1279027 RepID=UPI0003B6604F|nr:DUF2207 domain-containing protein [Hippea alviniae]
MSKLNSKLLAVIVLFITFVPISSKAEYFYIKDYHVNLYIHKDAVIDVEETIKVHFLQPRHGIIRKIPYKYRVSDSAKKHFRTSGDYYEISIYNVKVENFKYSTRKRGKYLYIKIGDRLKYVNGDVVYKISYTINGAINFFKDHSELYYNVIGVEWPVKIEKASFDIMLPTTLPKSEIKYLVFSGTYGSTHKEEATYSDGILSCELMHQLKPRNGLTVVLWMPKGYLKKSFAGSIKLFLLNNKIFALPIFTFLILFLIWYYKGKDEKIPIMARYKPPENITPAEAGVLINDRIDNHDLIALIFWWANKGYLEIEETTKKSALFKKKDIVLIKKKDLPDDAEEYEKVIFNGLFPTKNVNAVRVSSLRNKFYKTMELAKDMLDERIKEDNLYTKGSRGIGITLIFISMIMLGFAGINFFDFNLSSAFAFLITAIICFVFGRIMPQKTSVGLKKYSAIKGFKEFMDRAEKDRLKRLLDENPNYFFDTLAYAVAFGDLKKWAEKFKDLNIQPPNWYRSDHFHTFSVMSFADTIDHNLSTMATEFTSSPSGSGSSGFSGGGGGFSGGGMGGGGGSSW